MLEIDLRESLCGNAVAGVCALLHISDEGVSAGHFLGHFTACFETVFLKRDFNLVTKLCQAIIIM